MQKCNFVVLAVCLSVLAISTVVSAQDGDRRMMDHGRGGGMGGMGVGTGIGIGIGIGEALSQRPAAEPTRATQPEVRRVSRKKVKQEKTAASKSEKQTVSKSDTAVKFDGKPSDVTHNPEHQSGTLGKQSDHKLVLVEKDGHYSKRNYYSGTERGDRAWYWYETPLADSDPVIPVLPYVATCSTPNDDCVLTRRKSSDPNRLKNPDSMIGTWWWPPSWGEDDPPAVPKGVCKAVNNAKQGDASGEVSCVNVGGSCTGGCDLINDLLDTRKHLGRVKGVAPGVTGDAGWTCGCPSN